MTTARAVTSTRKSSLTDEAYRAIKRMILSVELPPGTQFTEAQLSAELLLGKTPVREGLARLQREELVECIPRSGYRVATLTLKDVRDLFALRVLLEGEAARLASTKDYAEATLRRLEELCHITYVVSDSAAFAASLTANTEFHVLLARGSGNDRLVSMLRQVMQHMERVLHIGLSMTPAAEVNYREHPDLLRAVLRGDGEGARAVVEAQNRVWQDRMIDLLLSSEAVLSTNLGPPSKAPPRLSLVSGARSGY